jgi:methionyl-tRNA synthetase
MRTILHVALQAVSDCNTLLAPFLPHSAQQVHELLGRDGVLAPAPELREVDDLDGGPSYPVLTGTYDATDRWARTPITPGTPIAPPTPLFAKLDQSVVDEELARMEGA